MNYILNCIKEIFCPKSTGPAGLCYFDHADEPESCITAKPARSKEMRLSELME